MNVGFETKPEKERLPARSMLALGGPCSTSERPLDGSVAAALLRQLHVYGARSSTEVLEIVTARRISASLYHVTGRPWVTAHNTALKQASAATHGPSTQRSLGGAAFAPAYSVGPIGAVSH